MISNSYLPKNIVSELSKICGERWVSVREVDRIAYGRDSSTPALIEIRAGHLRHAPDVIVWPENSEEVCEVLKYANEKKIPVIPYGAGSGVCGGTIPVKGGIILDLKRMDQILSIDPEALTVTAQAGIMGEILERKLNVAGYTLGHFPSSIYTATLGGYLACRSAGQLSTKYGKIEDMVRSFKVCLADGRLLNVGASEKFDLKELFVGSEGTLGAMTEATLAIHPQPESQRFIAYQFSSVAQGTQAIRRFMQMGLRPAVVRLYDPLDSFLFSTHGDPDEGSITQRFFDLIPSSIKSSVKFLKINSIKAAFSQVQRLNRLIDLSFSQSLLILGFEGTEWKVHYEVPQVMKVCEEQGGEFLGKKPGLDWLRRRYSVSYKMSPVLDWGLFADTMEVAASWKLLPNLYDGIRRALQGDVLVMAHFSHAYNDGCSIYFTFVGYAPTEEESLKLHRRVWDKALSACLESGGTVSHHHGIGSLKAEAFVHELGPLHEWLKKAKQTLDPNGILNPGKLGL